MWPLGTHVDLPSHATMSDRINASDILINKYDLKLPILYDTMENLFDEEFAVWPERYYMIQNKIFSVLYEPTTEFGFDRNTMHESIVEMWTRFEPAMKQK